MKFCFVEWIKELVCALEVHSKRGEPGSGLYCQASVPQTTNAKYCTPFVVVVVAFVVPLLSPLLLWSRWVRREKGVHCGDTGETHNSKDI